MDQTDSKKALLVVSFGTSYRGAGQSAVEAIERELSDAFTDRRFLRAWTSGMIRKKMERIAGEHIPSVEEALGSLARAGVTDVLVQPTHLLNGEEFEKVRSAVTALCDRFEILSLGQPLLSGDGDIRALAKELERIYGNLDANELLAFMGHGSEAMRFPAYRLLERQFEADGYPNICIGTVEFAPGIERILTRIRREKPKRVHLAPLLLTAGDHVLNDMCGDRDDSWKNRVAREGVKVVCHKKGIGEYEAVRALYIGHAMNAIPAVLEE